MSFPETRLTLISRLANGGSDRDWSDFLHDYWGPVCGFAVRWGGLTIVDAEDVAGETFRAVLADDLLIRWRDNRCSRLRSLLCGVVKNIISNQARVSRGRQQILQKLSDIPLEAMPASIRTPTSSEEPIDSFYGAWANDLLGRSVDRLLVQLHAEGKGDYFRVLYGRLCEDLPMRTIAEMLGISLTSAENYLKSAKKRLTLELEASVREHVARYCNDANAAEDFKAEWQELSAYLHKQGGLERVVRQRSELAAQQKPPALCQAFLQAESAFIERK